MRPRLRTVPLCGLLALIALVVLAGPASAHAELESTDPQAEAQLDAAPDRVLLRYSEPVRTTADSLRVFDADGRRVDEGDLSRPDGDATLAVELPELGEGGYVVTYRVVSADAHPISGGFTFRVGEATAAIDQELVDELVAADGGSAAVGTAYAVVRFVAFTGLLLLVGGLGFVVLVWPGGARLRGPSTLLWAALAATAVATVVGLGLQGAYERGLGLADAFSPDVVSDVVGTRFGAAWLARLALLALTAVLLVRLRRRGVDLVTTWGAALLGAGLVVTPGFSGHASAGDLVPLALVSDAVHVAGVALWLGGLAVLLGFVLRRRDAEELRSTVPRFSLLAQVAVAAIVVTGVFQGWRQVGSLDALTSTTYGRLLLVKTIAFAGLLALGALNRQVVRRRLWAPSPVAAYPAGPGAALADPDADTVARLRRAVGIEVVVAVVIVAVTALLVEAEPARSAAADPFSASVSAEDVTFDVTVEPGQAGRNDVHIYLTSPLEDDPLEITAQASLPERGIAPIPLELEPAGEGHWSALGADLPIPGDWLLEVTMLVTDVEQIDFETSVPIR